MMALLFLAARGCLICLHWLAARRAVALEERHKTVAAEAAKLSVPRVIAPGETLLETALANWELMTAAARVRRAYDRYHRTQAAAEWLAGWKAWMAGEKGKSRAAWYLTCAFDMSVSSVILERLGEHTSRLLGVALEGVRAWL